MLRGEAGEKQEFRVPGITGENNSPTDIDLKSIPEAPLDGPKEGDNLQGEDGGQLVGLPPSVCSLPHLLVVALGVSCTVLGVWVQQ